MFQEMTLEEANIFFEKRKAVNENYNITSDDEPMYVDITSRRLQASTIINNVTQIPSSWK